MEPGGVGEQDHGTVGDVRTAEVVDGDADATGRGDAGGGHDGPGYGDPIAAQTDPDADADAVRAANAAFYQAFESRDLDEMSAVWEHSDRVSCVHPGWQVLRGWGAVAGSWFALFGGPQHLQFILTNESVEVAGDVGLVTVDENLLDGDQVAGTVTSLNVFARDRDGAWKLIAHHGSPVAPRS
jgi:ketosteroid isomerase-like protein